MEYQNNEDYGYEPQSSSNSTTNGLKIAIIILLIVLAGVSVLYWSSVRRDAAEIEMMQEDLKKLEAEGDMLKIGIDTLQTQNDTLNVSLQAQRHMADSLVQRIKKERNISYQKIRAYERELSTLRTTMQSFVRTIDSLDRINRKLVGQNFELMSQVSTLKNTADAAKETASELNSKIKRGAVIRARNITLRAVNRRDKEVTRARIADRLITTFELAANELSTPGERTVYIRIISPDGYDLAENQNALFEFEGKRIPYTASRVVDYQGEDLAVSVFYNGSGLTAGQYTVHVYIDGHLIGSNIIILK